LGEVIDGAVAVDNDVTMSLPERRLGLNQALKYAAIATL
jgi:hypothetical protein